jgi:hypothetical protein
MTGHYWNYILKSMINLRAILEKGDRGHKEN